MLSAAEREELERIAASVPSRHSAAIDGLLLLQRHRGWVSDEAIADLAAALDMTAAELDGIATFYSRIFRKPTGAHVLAVCDSVSCWVMGGERLLAELEHKLGIRRGQTTADGRFSLIPAVCLGRCDRAPALMVGERVVGDLTSETLDEMLAGLRARR